MALDWFATHFNDPSNYSTINPVTGKPISGLLRTYSYQVEVAYVSGPFRTSTQYITVSSNEVLSQDEIIAQAEAYATGSGNSGVAGQIGAITVTAALKQPG